MKWLGKVFLLVHALAIQKAAAVAEDWIDDIPLTVYEKRPIRAQNMDFDFENNLFKAHAGWLNDKLVHYYKFRMYTEEEYPGLISSSSTNADVLIQKVYILTTTGTLNGAIGKPIINHHSIEGNTYSDFMEIHLVTAPSDYPEADWFRSELDITQSGQPVTATGIIVNMPIVPLNSKLQYPGDIGTRRAPIDPLKTWYRGVEIWNYVFEVTDEQAATYLEKITRPESEEGFEITVTPFASNGQVNAIPIWHLNQYTNGVENGVNNGGPSPVGMRNVIHLDRPDSGYSPLWRVEWVTAVPMDFSADQVSHKDQLMDPQNGFSVASLPMWINCPNVGLTANLTDNPNKESAFLPVVTTVLPRSLIAGAPVSTVMQEAVGVSFETEAGVVLGFAETNTLGAYEFFLRTSAIPAGTTTINIKIQGETVREVGSRDYIAKPPPTVYETNSTTVHNMDYDQENALFIAHSTWYNDREVHTYKFRIYTPEDYPAVIPSDSATSQNVPFQKLYIVTTGGLVNSLGKPIMESHHVDGETYSDFMEIVFVVAPANYVTDSFRSVGDIVNSGAKTLASGILVNAPLVPNGAKLQDPARKGTRSLPIQPLTCWYKGVEVWTYLFETTDTLTANYYAWTRQNPGDPTYRIFTAPIGSSQDGMNASPMWFLNQYHQGVSVEKNNGGGPDPTGMRNLITLDRGDDEYSPLRHVQWVTALPMNYLADEISNPSDLKEQEGFTVTESSIFINAPGIGQARQQQNQNRKTTGFFETTVNPDASSNWIVGSQNDLIFEEGISVLLQTRNGATIDQVETNLLGGYEFALRTTSIPPSSRDMITVNVNGDSIRSLKVAVPTDPYGPDVPSKGWRMTLYVLPTVAVTTLLCVV